MGWISAKRTITQGPPVVINCPACRMAGITAIPRHYEEPLMLLRVIPLFTLRSTFIECGSCRQSLSVAVRDLVELDRLSPAELTRRMRPYVSSVGRFLVVSALLLFWFPFLAPALALGGLWMTRRHAGWRRMAIVAVVLSCLVALAAGTLLFLTADARAT